MTVRAMRAANVFKRSTTEGKRQYYLEAEACLFEVERWAQKIECEKDKQEPRSAEGTRPQGVSREQSEFFQKWVRSRNDVMTVNASMSVGTILALIMVPLVGVVLRIPFQVHWGLLVFNVIVAVLLLVLFGFSWWVMREEVERIEAGIYKMLAGQCASQVALRSGCDTHLTDGRDKTSQ